MRHSRISKLDSGGGALAALVVVVALVMLAPAGLGASPSATSAKPGATIPSLTLLVRILPNEIVPLHLQVMKRPAAPIDAKSLGAPVLLNPDGWTRRPPGTSELQIGVHSRTGALLAVHGWPARAVRFNDRATATPDVMLEGDVVASLIADRTLTFPLRRDASVAVLYRLTVARPHLAGSDQQPVFPSMSVVEPTPKRLVGEGPYGRVELEVLPLAAFLLSGLPDHPAAPAKEGTKLDPLWEGLPRIVVDERCFSLRSLDLALARWRKATVPELGRFPISIACLLGAGSVLGVTPLVSAGSPSDRFDVVVLGDGFAPGDMAKFDDHAMRLKNAFLATEPFMSEHARGRINIHAIRTESKESGISQCPDAVERKTYYRVAGSWPTIDGMPGGPGYFGTQSTCLIRETIEKWVAPIDQIEAVIVIANCDINGGSADFDNEIAFAPTYTNSDGGCGGMTDCFERIALHEIAHTVGDLGEEYNACARVDPNRSYFNIVEEQESANAWWKRELLPTEKDASGGFLVKHEWADGFRHDCRPKLSSGDVTMLGLYWGVQYGDESKPWNTDCGDYRYCGEWLKNYYRPAFMCRMRYLSKDFCRACVARLREVVTPP